MRWTVGLASLALAVGILPARAAKPGDAVIRITYQRPAHEEMRAIYRDLKARRVLEGLRTIVGGVRLPQALTLRLSACGGEPNAWYAPENRTITVCYEYVQDVRERASTALAAEGAEGNAGSSRGGAAKQDLGGATRSKQVGHVSRIVIGSGVTRDSAVFGFLAQIFLHELGHALYHLLDVPVLGREEDAADQFAAIVLLELPPRQARYAIDGIAHLLRGQADEETPDREMLADDHSLTGQRLYNLLCLAYGADRRTFGYLVDGGALPRTRATQCGAEYDLAAYALQKLFRRHLREGRMDRARIRRAFRWML